MVRHLLPNNTANKYTRLLIGFICLDAEELMASQMIVSNSTCVFRNQEPNVISFYNDQEIKEDVIEFPAGALLISRCIDIGKYAMVGK